MGTTLVGWKGLLGLCHGAARRLLLLLLLLLHPISAAAASASGKGVTARVKGHRLVDETRRIGLNDGTGRLIVTVRKRLLMMMMVVVMRHRERTAVMSRDSGDIADRNSVRSRRLVRFDLCRSVRIQGRTGAGPEWKPTTSSSS